MANVAPYVAQIRSAVYGEEVRGSIASAIEEMNDDNIETLAHYNSTIADVEEATDNANDAATAANDIADEVQEKLDHGDFVGEQGPEGQAATVQIGTVQTGQAGSAAQVTNTGTNTDAVFNFVIPQGATGTVDNLETVAVNFNIDSTYQNIASGMTVTQLFARIQLLLDNLFMSATEVSNLADALGISTSRLYGVLNELVAEENEPDAVTLYTTTNTVSINANAYGAATGSITVPDGYHAAGIVKLVPNASGAMPLTWGVTDAGAITVGFRNITSSTINQYATVTVLCLKNS